MTYEQSSMSSAEQRAEAQRRKQSDTQKLLAISLLKLLWNRGWGRKGYEWLRVSANEDEKLAPTLSAAALLDVDENALWNNLRYFSGKKGKRHRIHANQTKTLALMGKRTTWWAPKFN